MSLITYMTDRSRSLRLDGGEHRWMEVEPLLFQLEGSDEQLAFRQDGEGRIEYLFGESNPPNVVYEKLPPYESSRLHLGVLAANLAVFLLTALAWPVRAVISRLYRRRYAKRGEKPGRSGGAARRARVLAWSVSILGVIFVIGMVMVISNVTTTAYGASTLLISVLTVPLLIAALTAGVLTEATLAWRRGYWGIFGRLHYSLVALSALTFATLLAYYNLSGLIELIGRR